MYKVISLGNIMGESGWEVNDAHYTGITVELPEEFNIADVMKVLKDANVLQKHVTRQSLDIESYGNSVMIRAKKDGKWLWELQLAESK